MRLIFDLDSTLLNCESLEKAMEIALRDFSENEKRAALREIEKLTNAGMNGEISPLESLRARLKIAKIGEQNLRDFAENLQKNILPETQNLISKCRAAGAEIFIVSGAPEIFVFRVAEILQIPCENCRGVIFEFLPNDDLNFSKIAADKISLFESLNLSRDQKIVGIGDGATDLQLFERKLVDDFIAFTKFARRENVIRAAPKVAKNENELWNILENSHCFQNLWVKNFQTYTNKDKIHFLKNA